MAKTFIIIPTYNEADNITSLVQELLQLNIADLTVLIVDDNSPDGTGQIADQLAIENTRVKVLHRDNERGRGSAGIAGFKYALEAGADYIIEMDADGSHQPKYILDLLAKIKDYDVVLGSRFVPGGKDIDRGWIRQVTTFFAQNYIKLMLGVKVKDPTSGFRCFRREVLERINLDNLISTGPAIVSEILYLVKLNGFNIGEIPITFIDRTKGETKLNLKILLKTLYMVYKFKQIYHA
ncbi:polyprenol monophosphomannose synthase [Candidatus Saganbacteria bacterium]|nr:polyprenol monophosphomannose synthase [Candidatus Saganbacteria bacterium]